LIWLEGMGFAPYGEAYKLLEAGEFSMSGSLPVNPSGGVLSSNSIGASAMIRQAEIAIQMTEKGGDRQIDGAKIGLAHGWGGAIQFHTLMLQSKEEELIL
jgi:acetyl-CoA C-acetyltransferase